MKDLDTWLEYITNMRKLSFQNLYNSSLRKNIVMEKDKSTFALV